MELTLKQRKAVANGALPKFALGWEQPSQDDILAQAGSFLHSSTTQGVTSAAEAFKADLMAKNAAATDLGGMPSSFTKAPKGGAGAFLKNNAGGIMNIATGAMDFIGTMNDISTNKISSDEMMGSGGTSNESANGISYQQSKVDEAGYQNKIDATAKAGTMAAMGKGAALGGAIGSVIPGLGTVAGGAIGGVIGGIAGLFGSSKAKREAERQKRIAINRTTASNTQNREDAYTIGLRNEFNRENRTDTSQSLFHAALGKEKLEVNPVTGKTFLNTLRYTSHGPAIGPQGGWGTKGEVIADDLGYGYEIPTGPNDTAKIDVDEGDSIYSLHVKNPSTGNSVAHDAKILLRAGNGKMSISDKNWLDMNLQVGKMMKEAGRRKTNLLPGFLGGTNKYRQLQRFYDGGEDVYRPSGTIGFAPELEPGYTNAAQTAAATGGIAGSTTPGTSSIKANPFKKIGAGLKNIWGSIKGSGIDGYDVANVALFGSALNAAADINAFTKGGIRVPSSYRESKLGNSAIEDFSRMHSDYYPVWAQQREAEARGWNTIRNSGGLSAGQLAAVGSNLVNLTQQNMLQALFEHQGRENALRAQEAKAKLELGNQEATRLQQAYLWDEDMKAKAHASLFDAIGRKNEIEYGALQQTVKNAWEKDRFNRTMNLWQSDLKNDAAKTKAIIDSMNNNKPSQPAGVGTKLNETAKPEAVNTAVDAAKKAAEGAPKQPAEIDQPAPKWDGQYLSRSRKSKGENVANLQRNLAKALGQKRISEIMAKNGMKKGAKWDDGKFGNATHEALWEFQTSQGWTKGKGLDGVLGENTFNALQAAIKPKK